MDQVFASTPDGLQRRPYRSKRNRPCMLCRARKTSCRRADNDISCITCRKRGQRCSFLNDIAPEARPAALPGGSADDGQGLDSMGQPGDGFSTSILPESVVNDAGLGFPDHRMNDGFPHYSVDMEAMYGGFTDARIWSSPPLEEPQSVNTALGSDLMHSDEEIFEARERVASLPVPEALEPSLNRPNTAQQTEISFSNGAKSTLRLPIDRSSAATFSIDQRPDFQSTYFGLSGESDPYLLRHYLYNEADEFPFLRVIYRRTQHGTIPRDQLSVTEHPAATAQDSSHVPVQFLLTSNELGDELRRLGPTNHLYDHESVREELNNLVNEEIGQRLVLLFVQYVFPAFPVISRSGLATALGDYYESSSTRAAPLPGYLLAAIYASALPFTAYDDILCVSSVYKKPPAERLWQMVYDGVQTDLHTPRLATISAALLYLHRPRVGVQHVSADNSFAWSLMTSIVGLVTSLALHLDCRSWSIPPWEKRLRRRLWWMTFSEATWRSLLLGRPSVISPDQWNVSELTFADFEFENNPSLDEEISASNDFAAKLRRAMSEFNDGMMSQKLATLATIADNIYRCLYTIRATAKLADDLSGSIRAIRPLREELKSWYASLPVHLKTPRADPERAAPAAPSSAACLKFAYLTLEILLYRALLRPLGNIDLEDASINTPRSDQFISGFLVEGSRNDSDSNMAGQMSHDSLRNEVELIICAAENCARIVSTFTVELMSWDFAGFWYSWSRIGWAITSSFLALLFVQSPSVEHAKTCKTLIDKWRQILRHQSQSFEDMSLGILRLDAMYWSDMNKIFRINRHVAQVIKEST